MTPVAAAETAAAAIHALLDDQIADEEIALIALMKALAARCASNALDHDDLLTGIVKVNAAVSHGALHAFSEAQGA